MLKIKQIWDSLWLSHFIFVTLHPEVQNGLDNNLKH